MFCVLRLAPSVFVFLISPLLPGHPSAAHLPVQPLSFYLGWVLYTAVHPRTLPPPQRLPSNGCIERAQSTAPQVHTFVETRVRYGSNVCGLRRTCSLFPLLSQQRVLKPVSRSLNVTFAELCTRMAYGKSAKRSSPEKLNNRRDSNGSHDQGGFGIGSVGRRLFAPANTAQDSMKQDNTKQEKMQDDKMHH